MSRWDKGIDYEYARRRLERILRSSDRRVGRCYALILLIQLRNGSRISEAVRAFKRFSETGKTEIEVEVSKKKRRETRLMVLPEGVDPLLRECDHLVDVDDGILTTRIKSWCRKTLKFNTHSLRYSFVTYLLKQGVNPALISKITKHSKLDFILTYTQEKAADELLKKL